MEREREYIEFYLSNLIYTYTSDGLHPLELPGWELKLPPPQRQRQGTYTEACHGGCRSPHPSGRTINVYTEALMRFSHVHCSDGLSYALLSQGCIPEAALAMGMVDRAYIPRTGKQEGASNCLGPSLRSTSSHILSMTSSYTTELFICPWLLCQQKVNTEQSLVSARLACTTTEKSGSGPTRPVDMWGQAERSLSSKATVKWGRSVPSAKARGSQVCRGQGKGASLHNQEVGYIQKNWERKC